MSTYSYASLTNRRHLSVLPSSQAQQPGPTGLSTYVDAFAALVPSEVLTLHAVIITVTTTKASGTVPSTVITAPMTLTISFYALVAISVILYVIPRSAKGRWNNLDYVRMLIPPFAFIGWTMLQRTTAFDAVCPTLAYSPRTVIALFLGVLLGLLASNLASKAETK